MPWTILNPIGAQAAPSTTFGKPLKEVGETFGSLKEDLRLELGGRADAGDARLGKWINRAYLDICSSLRIEEMKGSLTILTTAAQALYKIPSVVYTIQGIAITTPDSLREGYPLEKMEVGTYRSLKLKTGAPTAYFRRGELIALWPTPDGVYSLGVDFRVRPAKLEEEDDSPALPEEWHEGILLLAKEKAFKALLEFDKGMAAGNDFTDFVRRKKDRGAEEDENRVVGSLVPRRLEDLRNRTVGSPVDWED